jgi:hypothetical protein
MYKAPLEDYQFVLDRVIGFDALMALIGNDDAIEPWRRYDRGETAR